MALEEDSKRSPKLGCCWYLLATRRQLLRSRSRLGGDIEALQVKRVLGAVRCTCVLAAVLSLAHAYTQARQRWQIH